MQKLDEVEEALYKLAVGDTVEITQTYVKEGGVEKKSTSQKKPGPNLEAIKFILVNNNPCKWKDIKDNEVNPYLEKLESKKNDNPIKQLQDLSKVPKAHKK